MKEIVTVQIQVEVEYNEKREGAREYILDCATQLHMEMCGVGVDVGCYRAKAIEGSGKVVSQPRETE